MKEKINKIFKELTYNDLNGGSIFISALLIIIFVGLTTYFFIQINLKLLQENWPRNRCNPLLMPFAGLIMPQSDQSALEYSQENFTYCSTSILRKLANLATRPLQLMEESILKMQNLLLEAVFAIIRLINLLKEYLADLLKSIFNKFQNILIAQTKASLLIGDIMNRSNGMLTNQFYLAVQIWNTFGSAMNTMWFNIMTFFSILFAILYGIAPIIMKMGAAAAVLLLIPFGFGVIPAGIINFTSILLAKVTFYSIVALIVICLLTIWIGPVINIVFRTNTPGLFPGDPTMFWRKAGMCFAKNTIIPTLHKGNTPIQHITPGTILADNSKVTATMILDSTGQPIFLLDNTIVTGSHRVLYKTNWIHVEDHPDAISLPPLNDPIYCFNTTNKHIKLHNTIYADWDDEEGRDLITLNNACGHTISEPLVFENIHKYLEVGFHPDMKLRMKDGTYKNLENIQLGEILEYGDIVTGCVMIQGDVPLYYHDSGIIGTSNIKLDNVPIKPYMGSTDRLYHLLTNTGTIRSQNHVFPDYNAGLDRYFGKKI
jgi:hypothetical protein